MAFWIPLLLMAAAAGASAAGNAKVKSASNRAVEQELERQRKFSESQRQEFGKSLQQNSMPEVQKSLGRGEEERFQDYEQAKQLPNTTHSPTIGQENVRNVIDTAQMRQGHRARAKLGGYDTWLLDNAVKNLRTSQQQRLINDASQRSQALLGMDLQDASSAGDGWQMASSLLGGAGSLYGLGGSGGGGQDTPVPRLSQAPGPTAQGINPTVTNAVNWNSNFPTWLGYPQTNTYGL